MKKPYLSLFLLLGLTGLLGSCGSAAEGFNANQDYELTLPTDGTLVWTEAGDKVPFQASVLIPADKSPIKDEAIPANGIQLFLVCSSCDFYDNLTGAGARIPYTNDVSTYTKAPNPYLVKTDDLGQYMLLIRFPSPGATGLTTYSGEVGVYMGNQSKVWKMVVSLPAL
jgi:hypothetical protein